MGAIEQILHLPYAWAWIPGLVFFAVVGGLYWLSGPMRTHADASPVAGAALVQAAKPKDLRGTYRRQGNTVEVHVATPADKTEPRIGSVLDRSMGGMRLALFDEVEVGAILSVRPVHADNIVPWIDLEVRSCKPSKEAPDQFEIGCQYVKSPPYSIQLLFG